MEKLIGNKNIAVFISGRGTNLKALINYSKKTKRFNITSVVSDNKNAKGLIFVKKNNIKCLLVDYKNKSYSEKKIYNFIKKENVSLVALAGFMRVLSKKLIKRIKISHKRPLAFKASSDELIELIKKRSNFYSKALYKVNCDNLTKNDLTQKIIDIYESRKIDS